jgi:anti-sigma factor RsiW
MLMADALGGELTGQDLARFESHLSECQACRTEYQSMSATVAAMRTIPGPESKTARPLPLLKTSGRRDRPLWMRSLAVLRYAAIIAIAFVAGYAARGVSQAPPPPGGAPDRIVTTLGNYGSSGARSFEAALSGVYRNRPSGSDLAKCMNALFPKG